MGCNQSSSLIVQTPQNAKGNNILLLGTGESGKTTLRRQFENASIAGISNYELQDSVMIIFSNIIDCCLRILDQIYEEEKLDEQLAESLQSLRSVSQTRVPVITDKTMDIILALLGHEVFISYEKSSLLPENWKYLSHRLRTDPVFARPGKWNPSIEDFFQLHTRTSGLIKKELFLMDGTHFTVIDTGGQKTERKKWVFPTNYEAIFYFVSLSDYDQMLYEDKNVNRFKDSLETFHSVCENSHFSKTPIYLFFNKKDALEEKLQVNEFQLQDYPGCPNGTKDANLVIDWFKKQYLKHSNGRKIQIEVVSLIETAEPVLSICRTLF